MARRRSRRVHILLPDEAEPGRRRFLSKGLFGTLLVALGGGLWFTQRKTQVATGSAGELSVFSRDEASVLLAIADRLVPERPGVPGPRALSLARRMDAVAARADAATQLDLRRLVRAFESALTGFLLDGQFDVFTASSPEAQDRRLRAWAESRIAVRRSGYRTLKRLVYGSYYGASESWGAVRYPGPPSRTLARESRAHAARGPERGGTPRVEASAPDRRAPVPAEAVASDGRPTAHAEGATPDRPATAPLPSLPPEGGGPGRGGLAPSQAPAPAPAPERRRPPHRKRPFKPLKPFDEQPLELAPTTMITPKVDDG